MAAALASIDAEPVSENSEIFRLQLLEFLHEMNDALVLALGHPVIGPQIQGRMTPGSPQVPLPAEAFHAIENATPDEIAQIRDAFALTPGILAAPAVFRIGLQAVPTSPQEERSASACTDIYGDFRQIVSLTETNKNLTIANNVFLLLKGILGTASGVLNAAMTTCESPIDVPLSWAQIPLIIVVGVVDLVSVALSTAVDGVGFDIVDRWRCINLANCPPQGFSERFRPDTAPGLMGKGCDNRDNNCTGGIDEQDEDIFPPSISIDATLLARCFSVESDARAAALLAVRASDDCVALSENPSPHEGALEATFSRVPCMGSLLARATDKRDNVAVANTFFAIDDVAPAIQVQDLTATCQPTVEAARQALRFTATDACSTPQQNVRVIEKQCVADFEFEARDACGNRSTATQSVRIDSSAPAVEIETLLLPDFKGRFCFRSEAEAVATVRDATTIGDNCSSPSQLLFNTTAQSFGTNSCDRRVVSTASDTCGLQGQDAVVVRLDKQVPSVSCAVQRSLLWPADSRMVDVGFRYDVQDNCGTQDVAIKVTVTSDEPTSFDLAVMGASDPVPDAAVQYDANGRVTGIQLRAERQQTTASDGRVYRIRVVATDPCGNSNHGDCYVTVPKVFSGPSNTQVTNSGQFFDATIAN